MTEVSNIILDLEILKQVSENDKIGIILKEGSKTLCVDSASSFSMITRWYNGYNREDCIEYLETLVQKIETVDKFLIDGNHINTANLLNNTIKAAIPGIENLKNTYSNDSIIIAKLTIIINKLNQESIVLNKIIKKENREEEEQEEREEESPQLY
jgi:hypothetical protein